MSGTRTLPTETVNWIKNFKKNYENIMRNGGYPGDTIRPTIGGMVNPPLPNGVTWEKFNSSCTTGTGADGLGIKAGGGAAMGTSSIGGGSTNGGISAFLKGFKKFFMDLDKINYKSFEEAGIDENYYKNPHGGKKIQAKIGSVNFNLQSVFRIYKDYTPPSKDERGFLPIDYFVRPTSMELDLDNEGFSMNVNSIIDSTKSFLPDESPMMERSFVDEAKYNCRATLAKAFPSYLICIVDEMPGMIEDKKLFSNYYVYNSAISLAVHHSIDSPLGTATITMSNVYDNVTAFIRSKTLNELVQESDEYNCVSKWLSNTFHIIPFEKITQNMIDQKAKLRKEINISAGARIHIRMGYGSCVHRLPTVFNGVITEMQEGEIVSIVAQSDGAELVSMPLTNESDKTSKDVGLSNEVSNIMANMLLARESNFWFTLSSGHWKNASRYGIEHFGQIAYFLNGFDYTQYDIIQNIYKGNYVGQPFCKNGLNPFDGEVNVCMFVNNQTVWDVSKICEKDMPDFIAYPRYYGFESRMFYGLPNWVFRSGYLMNKDTNDKKLYQTAKNFSQCHLITSDEDIVDNSIKTSSKGIAKNLIGVYTIGGSMASTPTIMSDEKIEWGSQTTKTIDTTTMQNLFLVPSFIEKALSWVGLYDNGKTNAIKVCVSELMSNWRSTYKGELIILGDGSIMPHDYLMLNDMYVNMSGICTVRESIHRMSVDGGYTTTIIPGMLVTNTLKNSGLINYYKSLLKLASGYFSYVAVNAISNKVTKVISDDICLLRYNEMFKKVGMSNLRDSKIDTVFKKINDGSACFSIDEIRASLKSDLLNVTTKCPSLDKVTRDVYEMPSSSKLEGMHDNFFVNLLPTTWLINSILSPVIEMFEYKNTILIYPMMLRDKFFCSGVRGASTIIPTSGAQKHDEFQD